MSVGNYFMWSNQAERRLHADEIVDSFPSIWVWSRSDSAAATYILGTRLVEMVISTNQVPKI